MSASSSFMLVDYASLSHVRLEAEVEGCDREMQTETGSAAAPAAGVADSLRAPPGALQRFASAERVRGISTAPARAASLGTARQMSQHLPAARGRLPAAGSPTDATYLRCRRSAGGCGGEPLSNSCVGDSATEAPRESERASVKVTFSVSGQRFETLRDTLLRFPDTLLGDPTRRVRFWDSGRRMYVFDRHVGAFQSILYYYQSGGRLYCPEDVPEDVFVEELAFYDLGDTAVRAFELRSGFLTKSVRRAPPPPPPPPSPPPSPHPSSADCRGTSALSAASPEGRGCLAFAPRPSLLLLLASTPQRLPVGGALFAVVSVLLTVVSMGTLCAESLPRFREVACTARPLLHAGLEASQAFEWTSTSGETLLPLSTNDFTSVTPTELPHMQQQQQQKQQQQQTQGCDRLPEIATADDSSAAPQPRELEVAYELVHNYGSPFFIVESCCAAWFTVEAALRCVAAASSGNLNGRRYFRSAENLFDLCAVVPYYASLAVLATTNRCLYAAGSPSSSVAVSSGGGGADAPLVALRVLRLAGAFRVLKLTRYWAGSRLLGYYLLRSCKECLLFIAFSLIAIASYAVAAYYADEHDSGGRNVRSIPDGMWYALITFWTIGYGDVVPSGPAGKAVGAACMLSGVVSVALLVPVVVANFASFYRRQMARRAYRCAALKTQ